MSRSGGGASGRALFGFESYPPTVARVITSPPGFRLTVNFRYFNVQPITPQLKTTPFRPSAGSWLRRESGLRFSVASTATRDFVQAGISHLLVQWRCIHLSTLGCCSGRNWSNYRVTPARGSDTIVKMGVKMVEGTPPLP